MAKYLSNRQKNLKIGILSYTENNTVLEVAGKVGIGTTNATQTLDIAGSLKVSGGIYDKNNTSGSSNYVPVSDGVGGWTWQASPAAGSGITVQEEGSAVGTSAGITLINFVGNNITATGIGANATVTMSNNPIFTGLTVNGNSVLNGDLYVRDTLTIGGTSVNLYAQQLLISDPDIVLGIGTSFSPTDATASHGGIAIASTEGIPLANLNIAGESSPYTYKKIMWFRGADIGVGITDAWLFNYGVGIGSTQVPNGVRLSAGGMQVTDTTVTTPQLSVSGISTFSNGPVLVGSATSTETASQRLQVTGGAYVSGSVGIGTTTPTQSLHVQGNARITGAVYDSTNSPGTTGQVLQSTITGTQWATASGGGGGSGKFDTTIDNVLYIQPTGTLDIVGVGTTTSQITTLPSSSPEYIIHSLHVTNISNGDAEITAGFIMNARKVPATISVSVGSSGGPGIHTFTVGSASSIRVGMAVTGTGNIGERTGIGTTAGFQFNTYVTSVDGNNITLSKPMSGIATGTLQFSPVSLVSSRLPVPVGSAVELLKQPMILGALDSIVLQSTGAGSGIGSTSTFALHQRANVGFLTVTAGAAITNFLASGMLIQPIGVNIGIQTNTFVGVGYTPGSLSIPITKPATTSIASTALSFTEVVVPQDGALQVTVVYQSSTDTSYQNGTGTVVGIVTLASQATSPVLGITSTTPSVYYGTGNVYPSTIQSIRVSNISDATIYPGGDYPVWVGIGNSDTIFSWLAYNMVIPRNSSIELCEAPKRLGIGQSIFAYSNTPNAIEIQIAGKQKI